VCSDTWQPSLAWQGAGPLDDLRKLELQATEGTTLDALDREVRRGLVPLPRRPVRPKLCGERVPAQQRTMRGTDSHVSDSVEHAAHFTDEFLAGT
jgi:hypothetical protein